MLVEQPGAGVEGDEHLLGVRVGQRHEAVRPVGRQIRRRTAQPDRDQRPEGRIAGRSHQQLGTCGRHRLHQTPAQAWPEQCGELRRRVAYRLDGVEPQSHTARGGLVQHTVHDGLHRHGAACRGERRNGPGPPVDDGAPEDREPERLENVLHLCGLQPAALRMPGEEAGHDATRPAVVDPGERSRGAPRPGQPLPARGRPRERRGRRGGVGEHGNGHARAGHGQLGHVLRLAEPDREDRNALLGRRGGDAGKGVGERGGHRGHEDRVHARVDADGGHRGGEHVRRHHRGGVHRVGRRGTARQQAS